jgi:general secretion pathway protein A
MYERYFGLREPAFRLTPDPEYLYLDDNRRDAVDQIGFGMSRGEGFLLLVGEVGLGKTTLCHALVDRLGPGTLTSFVFQTAQTTHQLLRAISRDFGAIGTGSRRASTLGLTDQMNDFLLAQHVAGKTCLLVVDEAQGLSDAALELLRMLSNLETRRSKLIRMLLVGQPEIAARLAGPRLRQLDQRISVRCTLSPLSATGTRQYVRHRLRVAGAEHAVEITDAAWEALFAAARGTPRLTNLLADRALLSGYVHGTRRIDRAQIEEAVQSLAGEPAASRRPPRATEAPGALP